MSKKNGGTWFLIDIDSAGDNWDGPFSGEKDARDAIIGDYSESTVILVKAISQFKLKYSFDEEKL